MTITELYNYLLEEYGERKCYISDLAKRYNIPISDANVLTLALGFKRGKCDSLRSLNDFSNNPYVRRVWERIK